MVVGLGHEPDPVAETDSFGPCGDRAVEDLRIGTVGVLVEKVMLNGPDRIPPEPLAGDGLLDDVLVGAVLGVRFPRTRERGSRRKERISRCVLLASIGCSGTLIIRFEAATTGLTASSAAR